MGCLNVDIRKLGEALALDVTKLGGMSVSASLYGEYLAPIVSEVGTHLNISCGIVCSLSDVFYLNVSPEEVQWITPDMGIVYNVMSNIDWTIE